MQVIEQRIKEYIAGIDTTQYGGATNTYTVYVKDQKKKYVKVQGLKPNKDYTFLVCGMDLTGKTYGVPAFTTFSTGASSWNARQNTAWEMKYEGVSLYENNYYSKIHMDVEPSSLEQFFVGVYPQDEISSYGSEEDFLMSAVEQYREKLRQWDPQSFWKQDYALHDKTFDYYTHLDINASYVAYAIGLNKDGSMTGNYAKSEPFDVDAYPRLDNYKYLVYPSYKDWNVSNDKEAQNRTIRISEEVRNESVKMYFTDFSILYRFVANFNPVNGALSIFPQEVRQNTILKIDNVSQRGNMTVKGWYAPTPGDTLFVSSGEIAHAELLSDGRYQFSSPSGTPNSGMGYVLVQSDGKSLMLPGSAISFPFYITKQ
jgi:hypothetical protein